MLETRTVRIVNWHRSVQVTENLSRKRFRQQGLFQGKKRLLRNGPERKLKSLLWTISYELKIPRRKNWRGVRGGEQAQHRLGYRPSLGRRWREVNFQLSG